jgi:inhibitor of KinA
MIGFMPGFPYMGELPQALATPRLKTPRLSVPAGSVAIAQLQTGIYPVASPGGWQIIGRTPVRLFDPQKEPPALLHMGDLVQFYQISEKEFQEWRSEDQPPEDDH